MSARVAGTLAVVLWTAATAVTAWAEGDAAAAAAERGWFGAARERWRSAAAGDAAIQIERLDGVEREVRRHAAQCDEAAGLAWSAAGDEWEWVAGQDDEACPSVPAVAGRLLVWNDGRSLRGAAIDTGGPPWPMGDADRATLLFPRGLSGLPAPDMPGERRPQVMPAPAAAAGRIHAVIPRGGGGWLCCLDLSAAAEGRLMWRTDAVGLCRAAGGTAPAVEFDGQPVADHESCLVIVRAGGRRGDLSLVACDARDGGLCWIRPLGPAVTAAGLDPARGLRQAAFAEDRIVVDTHAGSLEAFDRDGTPAWTTALPASAAVAGLDGAAQPPMLVADRLYVVAPGGGGIVAVEPRGGGIVWQWQPAGGGRVALLGGVDGDVVAAVRGGRGPDERSCLVRLAGADGRVVARRDVEGWQPAGRGVLAERTIFWPLRRDDVAGGGADLHVAVLDAATLEPRRPPVAVPSAPAGTAAPRQPPSRAPAGGDPAGGEEAVRLVVAAGRLVVSASGRTACLRAAAGGAAAAGRFAPRPLQ